VAFFGLGWWFQTRVRDVDEDEIEESGNTQSWDSSSLSPHAGLLSRNAGPLLPEARVVSVHVRPWEKGWLSEHLSQSTADLWDHIKRALKARFPEVNFG
jgi:hypothetical protein